MYICIVLTGSRAYYHFESTFYHLPFSVVSFVKNLVEYLVLNLFFALNWHINIDYTFRESYFYLF